MDKGKALKYLKEAIDKIPYLKTLSWDNQEYKLWRDGILDVLEASFGHKSNEYEKFSQAWPHVITYNRQNDYLKELPMRETALLSIIQKYELLGIEAESTPIAEPKDKAELPIYLFDKMQFHTQVVRVSRELFKDGHYRDAIFRAFVEVNNFVKLRAKSQLDGKKLMSTVFSPDNPIIKLNPLETQTDKDEQEGFMFLFMGAMQGIRNPKAHENIIQNKPYIALKLIGFASLLMETISFWEARET